MKSLKFLCLSLLIVTTLGCSSNDDSQDPTPQVQITDFEGSWRASSAVYTNKSNASENIEYIGAGGEIRYTMLPGGLGHTRIWVEFQNNPIDEWDAVVTLGANNSYTSTPAETIRPLENGTYTMGNNSFTLTNNNATFDFTLSGATPVPAKSVIIFVPNN